MGAKIIRCPLPAARCPLPAARCPLHSGRFIRIKKHLLIAVNISGDFLRYK